MSNILANTQRWVPFITHTNITDRPVDRYDNHIKHHQYQWMKWDPLTTKLWVLIIVITYQSTYTCSIWCLNVLLVYLPWNMQRFEGEAMLEIFRCKWTFFSKYEVVDQKFWVDLNSNESKTADLWCISTLFHNMFNLEANIKGKRAHQTFVPRVTLRISS